MWKQVFKMCVQRRIPLQFSVRPEQ